MSPVISPTTEDSQTITGAVEAGATVDVITDTAASDGNATVTATAWSYTITGLVKGENKITVTARDSAGNTATVTATIVFSPLDADNDGVYDSLDNCPTVPNPDQADSDTTTGIVSYWKLEEGMGQPHLTFQSKIRALSLTALYGQLVKLARR